MKSRIFLVLWLGMSAWAQSAPHPQAAPAPAPASKKTAPAATSATQHKPAAPVSPVAPQAKAATAPAKPVVQPKPAPPVHLNQTRAPGGHGGAAQGRTASERPTDSVDAAIRKTLKRRASIDKKEEGKAFTPAHRDPFVSPIVERKISGSACMGSGRQCLAVSDIVLHGVVEYSGGLIAVVVNGERTYFLREHDPLADGEVLRIGHDAIVMHERFSDEFGRQQVREVTKKIGAPAV
jgi:hypothetical protein